MVSKLGRRHRQPMVHLFLHELAQQHERQLRAQYTCKSIALRVSFAPDPCKCPRDITEAGGVCPPPPPINFSDFFLNERVVPLAHITEAAAASIARVAV
jgi:hypothetical protein